MGGAGFERVEELGGVSGNWRWADGWWGGEANGEYVRQRISSDSHHTPNLARLLACRGRISVR